MRDALFLPSNRFLWSLLAALGGLINTAGFLSVHRFVSHVTGFAGHFAVAVYDKDFSMSVYALSLPATFMIGSAYSAYFTEARRIKGRDPVYFPVMLTISGLLGVLAYAGNSGFLGAFGEPFENIRDFLLLMTLSFACGAQNALFTFYSGSIIRTTHLTGLTTDLGVGLMKEYFVKDRSERKFNIIRTELILSFISGSVLSVYLFKAFQFGAFYLLSGIALGISFRLYWTATHKSVTVPSKN